MGRKSKYDETFKTHAVGLVTRGQSAAQVARDLGLHVETLYQWVKRYGRSPSIAGVGSTKSGIPPGAVTEELEALRKENELLRMERDILKKAVGIFSRPPK